MNLFYSLVTKGLLAIFCICPLAVKAQNSSRMQNSGARSQYTKDSYNSDYQSTRLNPTHTSGFLQNDRNNNYSDYYENEETCEQCCDTDASYWDSMGTPLIIGAAAIGGGIVGALITGGRGHSGSDGEDGENGEDGAIGQEGPVGATGPGFTADTGQTLTFSLTSLFPASPVGSVTVLPFVTSPNGVTFEGPPAISPTAGGTISFPPIVILNPVFGFYNFGLSIVNTSTTTLAGITLNGTLVTASRDGSATNELTPLAGVSIAPGESQVSNTFTYDSTNVP